MHERLPSYSQNSRYVVQDMTCPKIHGEINPRTVCKWQLFVIDIDNAKSQPTNCAVKCDIDRCLVVNHRCNVDTQRIYSEKFVKLSHGQYDSGVIKIIALKSPTNVQNNHNSTESCTGSSRVIVISCACEAFHYQIDGGGANIHASLSNSSNYKAVESCQRVTDRVTPDRFAYQK